MIAAGCDVGSLTTKAVILDTRKTAPGWRRLDKYAVRMGGGQNHRVGLFDMLLIKDNHIRFVGGIGEAVMALCLSDALCEKFGGDSIDEMRRNHHWYEKHLKSRMGTEEIRL